MDQNLVKLYKDLRLHVDALSVMLSHKHHSQLMCKKGCDMCCESLHVFPIEFYTIKQELADKPIPEQKWKNRFSKSCRFLVNSECTIYESRPIICRTQGLPLLYENSQGTAYELSVCQLNFKGVDIQMFNMDNALFMPPINSKLYLLNQKFIKTLPKSLAPHKRIRLNSL